MTRRYETQNRRALDASTDTLYVWRCARCRRFLARIERLDGVLEVYHKCGAMNRLAGIFDCQDLIESEDDAVRAGDECVPGNAEEGQVQ